MTSKDTLPSIVCAIALIATGCSSDKEAPEPAPSPASEEVPAPSAAEAPAPTQEQAATKGLMRDHFLKAREAREALIRDDMPRAKAAMKWLAEHERAGDLPEHLRPLLAGMQREAGHFAEADSLRAAGDALAHTLRSCAVCHKVAGKGPEFARAPAPEGKSGPAHMARHHWAAQRMWEGLVMDDAELFDEAAHMLDEPPIGADELGNAGLDVADVARLDAHIHKLGGMVKDTKTPDGRAELYGRVLATCTTCHRMMKQGPQPLPPAAP